MSHASEALSGARLLLDGGNRKAVCLAEQAVEHLVLANAQAENLHFPGITQHQLDTMIRTLPPESVFRNRLFPLAWLEAYATTFRYPRTSGGIGEPPSVDRSTEALRSIATLVDAFVQHFGVTLAGGFRGARTTSPPR